MDFFLPSRYNLVIIPVLYRHRQEGGYAISAFAVFVCKLWMITVIQPLNIAVT